MVGWTSPVRRARTQVMPPTAPAAPRVCPIIDLVALTRMWSARALNRRRIAVTSTGSPMGVAVDEQAVEIVWLTPLAPKVIATIPDAEFRVTIGMKFGWTRLGRRSR